MNIKNIAYWSVTGIVIFAFAAGGLADLSGAPAVIDGMKHLGYPAYVAGILGFWKVLGAIAIAVPGTARLKEWAYAGMLFDLSGAAVSHFTVGDDAAKVAIPVVLLALVFASWALRPAGRVLRREVQRAATRHVQAATNAPDARLAA